jgi:hypothetical protein
LVPCHLIVSRRRVCLRVLNPAVTGAAPWSTGGFGKPTP